MLALRFLPGIFLLTNNIWRDQRRSGFSRNATRRNVRCVLKVVAIDERPGRMPEIRLYKNALSLVMWENKHGFGERGKIAFRGARRESFSKSF